MDTATATAPSQPIQVDSAPLTNPTPLDTNPIEVRWGIQVVLRDKPLNAQECGWHQAPFGHFRAIHSVDVPRENHTIDWTQPKERMVLSTAAEREAFIREAIGGAGAQNKVNWGFMTGFHGELDSGKMAVLSATLLPTLSEIRAISEEFGVDVIGPVCEGSDDLDFGRREQCVTCWNRWIRSTVVDEYAARVVQHGREVHLRDPQTGNVQAIRISPTIAEFQKAKELMIESFRIGIPQLEKQWKEIAQEAETPGSGRTVTDFENAYRKDLHRNQPEDRQLAITREALRGVGQAAAGGSGSDALMAQLVQGQLKMGQAISDLAAIVRPDLPQPPVADEPLSAIQAEEPVAFKVEATETVTEGLAPAAQAMEDAKNGGSADETKEGE